VNELARIFEANATTVPQTELRAPEKLAILHRHAALDDQSDAAIIASAPDDHFRQGNR
jgi:hypothetical protein